MTKSSVLHAVIVSGSSTLDQCIKACEAFAPEELTKGSLVLWHYEWILNNMPSEIVQKFHMVDDYMAYLQSGNGGQLDRLRAMGRDIFATEFWYELNRRIKILSDLSLYPYVDNYYRHHVRAKYDFLLVVLYDKCTGTAEQQRFYAIMWQLPDDLRRLICEIKNADNHGEVPCIGPITASDIDFVAEIRW